MDIVAWDKAGALCHHRTAMLVQGTACKNKKSTTVRWNMLLVHLATGSMDFRPIFQPGHGSPLAATINYLFMKFTYL